MLYEKNEKRMEVMNYIFNLNAEKDAETASYYPGGSAGSPKLIMNNDIDVP
jgi:hypothetical protein